MEHPVTVKIDHPPEAFSATNLIQPGVYIFVALLAAWLVHHLTERRERRKSTFDLHANLINAIKAAQQTADARWDATTQNSRKYLIRQMRVDLQRVGAAAQQVRLESNRRRRWRRQEIDLQTEVADFKRSIETANFEDHTFKGKIEHKLASQQHAAVLISKADWAVIRWMS